MFTPKDLAIIQQAERILQNHKIPNSDSPQKLNAATRILNRTGLPEFRQRLHNP